MSGHLIADDCFVITARGAVLADELEPGRDQVLIVRGGALKLAGLDQVRLESEPREMCRMLTPIGDIVLATGSFLMTRDGPVAGDDISMQIAKGKQPRMEIVSPVDLPEASADPKPQGEVERGCILSLPRRIVQIPRNGADALVVDQVERCLRAAQVEYREFRDERWVAFEFDAPAGEGSVGPWGVEHADALLDLTAWEPNGESAVSRVRFGDALLRRRLIASLAGSRRDFEIKWVPLYRPIECRIHLMGAGSMKPFVPIQAAIAETGAVRHLEISDRGHLVLGLAIVAPDAG
jgi:hypothetical protein